MNAVLRVIARDGTERTIQVDGTPLTMGRATDNVLGSSVTRVVVLGATAVTIYAISRALRRWRGGNGHIEQ